MTQQATVVRLLSGGRAEIRVQRQSACGHDCATCKGCGMEGKPILVPADNPAGAKPGDRVMVESDTRKFLGLAALTYLAPLALLFVGYGLLSGFSEGVAVLGAVGGLALGCLLLIPLNRFVRDRRPVKTVITEILGD